MRDEREDEEVRCSLRRIEQALKEIIVSITDAAAAQADEDTVLAQLITLTDSLVAEVTALRGEVASDPVKVQAVLDDFAAEKAKIVAALSADTPAPDPAPVVEPAPADAAAPAA